MGVNHLVSMFLQGMYIPSFFAHGQEAGYVHALQKLAHGAFHRGLVAFIATSLGRCMAHGGTA